MTNTSWLIILINLILLALTITFVVWRVYYVGPENVKFHYFYLGIKYGLGLNLIGAIIAFATKHKSAGLGFLMSLVVVGITWYIFTLLASVLWQYM